MRPAVTMRRALLAVSVLAAVTCPRLAWADDTAAADALFVDGKTLMENGRLEEACPKFEASFELSKALGTLLNVADCRERNGDLAVALDAWNRALALATEKGDDRKTYADERRAALEPKVPKIALDVKLGAEKLAITLDGKPVDEAKWGLVIYVDPGTSAIEVLRGDTVLDKKTVEAREGETKRVAIDLDAIAKAHPKKVVRPVEKVSPAQQYAGIVVMSVGLAGMATFGILEGVAFAKRAEADGEGGCIDRDEDTTICSPRGYELAQEAGDLAEIGQWMGVGGLATAAVGLTVFLTAPKDEPDDAKAQKATATVLPWVSPTGGGVVVWGRF
ncbi:MAG: tetratricopeptide repeat protein [Polyangiaceae bacterium]|nr:tetratricopeptide repeat protein [Polyangiaceae bacterium]